jgi:hypothetical protein
MMDTSDKLLMGQVRCLMGAAHRQFTDEFKREAVGLLASSGPAVEPDCPGTGDCRFEAARLAEQE